MILAMGYTTPLDSSASDPWGVVSLLVEAGLSLHNGATQVTALQLGAAALAYRSSTLGTIARVGTELYKRARQLRRTTD